MLLKLYRLFPLINDAYCIDLRSARATLESLRIPIINRNKVLTQAEESDVTHCHNIPCLEPPHTKMPADLPIDVWLRIASELSIMDCFSLLKVRLEDQLLRF